MSKWQLIGIAAGVLVGILDDLASFAAAKEAEPDARWNWIAFWRHVGVMVTVGLGGGTITSAAGVTA